MENVLGRGGGRVSGVAPEGVATAAMSNEGLEQLPRELRDNEPLGARGGDSGGDLDGEREGSPFTAVLASEARMTVSKGSYWVVRTFFRRLDSVLNRFHTDLHT